MHKLQYKTEQCSAIRLKKRGHQGRIILQKRSAHLDEDIAKEVDEARVNEAGGHQAPHLPLLTHQQVQRRTILLLQNISKIAIGEGVLVDTDTVGLTRYTKFQILHSTYTLGAVRTRFLSVNATVDVLEPLNPCSCVITRYARTCSMQITVHALRNCRL